MLCPPYYKKLIKCLRLSFLILLILSARLFAAEDDEFTLAPKRPSYVSVYRPSAAVLLEKAKEFYLSTEAFSKKAGFDNNGSEVGIIPGDDFQMMNTNFGMSYGLGQKLEVGLFGRYRQLRSKSSTSDLSNNGMESLGIRSKLGHPHEINRWLFSLEFSYRQTLYDATASAPGTAPTNEIILGDPGKEIKMGGHASRRFFDSSYLNFSALYVLPPNDLSHEINYDTHYAIAWSHFAITTGVQGIYSMKQDPYAGDPGQKPSMSTGTTAKFNSINREEVSPYAKLSLSFGSFKIDIFASQTIAGKSTDKGQSIGAALLWGKDGIHGEGRKLAKFKEYQTESYVMKISPRGKFFKIDKGMSSDIEKGSKVDIFKTDFFGENILVASGIVFEVGPDWGIVRIETVYRTDIQIEKGFVVRGE